MPKYMFKASLSPEGVAGVRKEGGTGRRQAADQAVQKLGGTLESFYFAFGETDAYAIADFPDNETAAAFALEVSASGRISVATTVLLTPEEVDRARTKEAGFRPPGG